MKYLKAFSALLLLAVAGCADGPTSNSSINHKFTLTQVQRNNSNNYPPGADKQDGFASYYMGYSEDPTHNTRMGSGLVGTSRGAFTPALPNASNVWGGSGGYRGGYSNYGGYGIYGGGGYGGGWGGGYRY